LGIYFAQWEAKVVFTDLATQEDILAAYEHELSPYMEKNAYQSADVISINHLTENYPEIRAKFLAEHTHSEDEVRFFVDGKGYFWFNLENNIPIFNVMCEAGDLISVPAGTKHWFDAGETNPFVKTIRIFTDTSGWTPLYTHSGIEKKYQ
jgi:1,2-dihydroxy-3-keto-5-methylthiopentene dioxygenase